MKNRVVILLVSLLVPSVSEAAGYQCRLTWDTNSEGRTERAFNLSGTQTLPLHKNDEVTIEGDRLSSSLTITQNFEAPPGAGAIIYHLRCDAWLNCQGERVRRMAKQPPVQDTFTFGSGTLVASARIGEHELFRYKPSPNGFNYRFIAYELPDGETKGMEVRCHE